MPELPEVESVVRRLRPALVGRRIDAFSSSWAKQCNPAAKRIARALAGRRIDDLQRRAKFIVWKLDGAVWLLVHLRMSGRLEFADEIGAAARHVRAEWRLDNGRRLVFDDARKFGRILLTSDLDAATHSLGVEPLSAEFTPERLARLVGRRARALKPLLLDQSVVAGLGNIYVDESLFRARLHPLARSDELTRPQIVQLHRAIRDVLRAAIDRNGTSFDWIYPGGSMQDHLSVYGRDGAACRRCRTPIERLRIGQRSSHVCPCCQALSPQRRPSAGRRLIRPCVESPAS